MISVIMPCYNAERFIRPAIESVLNQSFKNIEFIIIDDGSTDRSSEIIKNYQLSHEIIYIKNEKRKGVAASLNKGIQAAKGEFIARMDADDIAVPERFEKQIDYMRRNKHCVVCGSHCYYIDEKDQIIGKRYYAQTDKMIRKTMLQMNPFAHPSTIIRKSVLTGNNIFYSDAYKRAEDYHLWFRLSKYGTFANINSFLLMYRISEDAVKLRHTREMLWDTIRLKLKYRCYKEIKPFFIILLESILFLLPRFFIIKLFKMKYKG